MFAQGVCQDKFLEIKNIFNNFLETKQETGAAFSVIKNKKKLISIYGGIKNSKNDPWMENTIVNTFSTSKGIYETCIAKLINENIINIQKPVCYYWPTFRKKNKSSITVQQVLSHQSGVYRFKNKLTNQDLTDWDKIIYLLEDQEPDYTPGLYTHYHAKTHGYIIGNLIKIITNLSLGKYLQKEIAYKNNINFYFGLSDERIYNSADLSMNIFRDVNNNKIQDEFTAFNNPNYDINYYNSLEWRKSEIPSMGGHGNSDFIAFIYDMLANDLKYDNQNIIKKELFKKYLKEDQPRKDLGLNFFIRWSKIGFILRGGWMFGRHKESFGHNGWGGSLGFADPINGFGISYVTRELNPTMAVDGRGITLIKKFYELYEKNFC